MAIFPALEFVIVAAAIVSACAYAAWALCPAAIRTRLALRHAARLPPWLSRRLLAKGGCAACPGAAPPRRR